MATLVVPGTLIRRARHAGVNCSSVARRAIEDAVEKLEPKETGAAPSTAQTPVTNTSPKGGGR